MREYPNVNPVAWGEQFDWRMLLSEPAMAVLARARVAQAQLAIAMVADRQNRD